MESLLRPTSSGAERRISQEGDPGVRKTRWRSGEKGVGDHCGRAVLPHVLDPRSACNRRGLAAPSGIGR